MNYTAGPAESLYERLKHEREDYIDRAELCAEMTIPALFPDEGWRPGDSHWIPNQSFGARLLNNLASKIMLGILPPGDRFFRLVPRRQVRESTPPDAAAALDSSLSDLEREVLREIETRALRSVVYEAMQQILVAGNAVVHITKTGGRVYNLRSFTVTRDGAGNPLHLVLCEKVDESQLPLEVLTQIANPLNEPIPQREDERRLLLYTHVSFDDGRYTAYQEVRGVRVPGSESRGRAESCPWIILRRTARNDEHYGRSFVEDYLADLRFVDSLTRSVKRSAAIGAKTIFLVDPNGMTDAEEVASLEEGGIGEGRAEDINAVSAERFHDLSYATAVLDGVKRELAFAFLLNSAVQRSGERVTAEEIRRLTAELEDALGGFYSTLAREFQYRLVKTIMFQMRGKQGFPTLSDDLIDTNIVTGVDSLGRNRDVEKITYFMDLAQRFLGPQAMGLYAEPSGVLSFLAANLGLDSKTLIRSAEQVAQIQQAQQQAALVSQATPNAVRAIGDAVNSESNQ